MKLKKLPDKKHKGLSVYCSKCKKPFSWTQKSIKNADGSISRVENKCGDTGVSFSKCKFREKQKYKARFNVPGAKGAKVSKILKAELYEEAIKETLDFEKEFKSEILSISTTKEYIGNLVYLWDSQLEYLNFLDNIGVPEHQKVIRTEKHIKSIQKSLVQFNESLRRSNINKKLLTLDKINDDHVGLFHSYLINEMGYQNKTYNGKMSVLKTFFKWAIHKYNLKGYNPFEKVKYRTFTSSNDSISKKEFLDLLSIITPENGVQQLGGKTREKKNMYREYLKDGIELCLHTGGRREEVVELKWDMIRRINGEPAFIEINNFKVERQLGVGFNENVAPKIIPMTKGLQDLLNRLGYEEKYGTHEYIICPDRSNISTKAIMENLSKGFGFYFKQLNTGKNLQLKSLRKTYLTYLNAALHGDTTKLSSHTTDSVLEKHYIDKKIVHKAIQEVQIFG